MQPSVDFEDGPQNAVSENDSAETCSITNVDEVPGDTDYTVPEWFLRYNVKLYDKPSDDGIDINIIEDESEGDTKNDNPTRFEVLRDDYEIIRLTASSSFINDKDKNLPESLSTITMCTGSDCDQVSGSTTYLAHLVRHLACDSKADLISINLEDLEDLGWEYHVQDHTRDQQVEDKPKEDSPYAFALFYFCHSSEDNPSPGAAKRIDAAIRAILNCVRQGLDRTPEEVAGRTQATAIEKPPIILHITGLDFLDYSSSGHLLKNFAEYIKKARRTTEESPLKVLGVASGLKWWSDSSQFLAKNCNQLKLPLPPNYSSNQVFYKKQETGYSQAKNIRRFKRILWRRLSDRFEDQVLDMHNIGVHQQRWLSEIFPGSEICDLEQLERAATQITGKFCNKEKLSMDDIVDVCSRLRRKGLWSCKANSHPSEKVDDDNTKTTENLSWNERKKKISSQCNPYEKELLGSVIDPATITTTFDDVIIDENVKEQIKLLITLSKLQPKAESRALLDQIRVTGALFYGPPGTGKTHLCKAIANDSRSNMLALSPAVVNNKFVGESEKIIAAAFSLSTKLSPCVLFIDEADALFFRRTSNDKRWERSELNQFLQEMDGLTKATNDSPFVIIGTNRPSELDEAFLRRLPYKISFPMPDTADRARILRVFLHTDDRDPEVNLDSMADRMKGFSGSDIWSFCGHAALAWAVEKSRNSQTADSKIYLQQHHFEAALKMTKPTVSKQSTAELREFEKRFNPEGNNILAAVVDSLGSRNAADVSSIAPPDLLSGSNFPGHSTDNMSSGNPQELGSGAHSPEEKPTSSISSIAQNQHCQPLLLAEQSLPSITISKSDLKKTPGYAKLIHGAVDYEFLGNQPPGRSLGRLAEDCFGIVDTDFVDAFHTSSSDSSSLDSEKEIDIATVRAFTNWYRLQYLFFCGHADRLISWEQRYSYQLLYDWWSGAYQDPSMTWNILMSMLSRSKCISSTIQAIQERGNPAMHDADDRLKPLVCFVLSHNEALHLHTTTEFTNPENLEPSRHTKALLDLFETEFYHRDAYQLEARFHHSTLQSARRETACEAYRHQAAMQYLGLTRSSALHHQASVDRPGSWICSVEASDNSYPRTLSRGPLIRSCPWLDLKTSTSPRNATRVDDGGDALDGWPEYLWDIEEKCIVSTRRLPVRYPAYIAISHTWGRWVQKSNRVRIPGGLEPPVPRNTIFDVEDIPNMLHALKTRNSSIETNYVWLDLVCVPQVPPKEQWAATDEQKWSEWERVQNNEIARQASIFRNAQLAIAWLHDVKDLSCLSALSELFSLRCAEPGPGLSDSDLKDNMDRCTADTVVRTHGRTTGFVGDKSGPVRYAESSCYIQAGSEEATLREPTGWFTSLWTLQEVCLRPDMWLATSKWDMLSYNNGEPVPFNGFLCLKQAILSVDAKHPKLEPLVQEISEWELATGLSSILDLSRVDILQLGDRRQCVKKHRRAEAIMSALGTTQWFKKDQDRTHEDLILGKYPIDFIDEIRQSFAGHFFSTYAKTPHADPYDNYRVIGGGFSSLYGRPIVDFYEQTATGSGELWGLRGSLLSFSEMGHHYFRHPMRRLHGLEMTTHNSVDHWKILSSGRVQIPEACVLSSSIENTNTPKSPTELPYMFWGFMGRQQGKKSILLSGTDIHTWTKERKSEIHIVVVMSGVIDEAPSPGTSFDGSDLDNNNSTTSDRGGHGRGTMHIAQGIVLRSIKADSQKVAARRGQVRDLEGKPQRLVKIGNFFCSTPSTLVLPRVENVNWEIL